MEQEKETTFAATEVKNQTGKVFDAVDRNGRVYITNFNKIRYVIMPYDSYSDSIAKGRSLTNLKKFMGKVGTKKKVDVYKFFRKMRDAE